ncbi:hypothetical protein [Arthrobacter sp. HY1533]|uniref:hypothetical protein n=1 Tax=Arthrobacter sp. HY1533 TaxID=2970919 RepID=UPI0022BA0126|nr:hypothetical protein [Arthrobacter sp. HY1533]
MDPIESMLRSINPVPGESAGTTPSLPPGLLLAEESDARTGGSDSARISRARTPGFAKRRALVTAMAAVVLVAAAGVFGVLAQGVLKPQPAGPTPLPSPSSTAAPTQIATPQPSPTPVPSTTTERPPSDPATGAACVFRNVSAEGVPGQMPLNMETYPGDFKVLGCTDGMLAFELTDTGYQRLLAQGAGAGAFGVYYIARFAVSGYIYDPEVALPGWDIIEPVDGTLAEKAVEMDRLLQEQLGVMPIRRPELVGGPPASPDAAPAGPRNVGADDPNNGSACSIKAMTTVGDSENWLVKDIAAHTENYRVVHCAGGWLAFQLSDAGRQSWHDDTQASGQVHEGSDSFYFAKYNGTAYEFTPGTSVPDWESRSGAGASPESMIESMVQDMEAAGIPADLRLGLVGEPPE